MLQAIDAPAFDKWTGDALNTYLLLESELVEDCLRSQPGAADQLSLAETVKQMDFCAFRHWVWATTDYDTFASRGPLLVQVEPDSPLLEPFATQWAAADGGLFIAAKADMDSVLAHLRNILFVYLPDGSPARFRLQDPLALAAVIETLAPERAERLFGPLQHLIWRESSGPRYRWWHYEQAPTDSPAAPFVFTQREMTLIDKALDERFLAAQIAWTEQAESLTTEEARLRVNDQLEQLRQWGFAQRQEQATCLDLFRHPEFPGQASEITDILADGKSRPGNRITRATNRLVLQGA